MDDINRMNCDNEREVVIKLDHVTKVYKLFRRDKDRFRSLFSKKQNYKKKISVNDANIEIKKGETVAIFGKNGAGKSTLLKMITGVVYPTKGEVIVNGRVSALLELTAGFDPEFTGRENIRFRGQLLGLSREAIAKVEPDIIDFAELEDYIDQPVRTYSSGMKARLGFATNANVHPEILIVDEALSVGDSEFRKKSSDKIREIVGKENVTFLFVTHSTEVAKSFCERGIVMHLGKILFDGPIDEAIYFYKDFLEELAIKRQNRRVLTLDSCENKSTEASEKKPTDACENKSTEISENKSAGGNKNEM